METVKSIRRKVPGSAYFKLSNTTIRDRRFRYAHPFCHSRQKGIFALKSFAFHCLRNLQSRSLHLLAGCASAWFCAVIFQLNKATVKRRRMINGLFDLILIIVRMTQQNIPEITAPDQIRILSLQIKLTLRICIDNRYSRLLLMFFREFKWVLACKHIICFFIDQYGWLSSSINGISHQNKLN